METDVGSLIGHDLPLCLELLIGKSNGGWRSSGWGRSWEPAFLCRVCPGHGERQEAHCHLSSLCPRVYMILPSRMKVSPSTLHGARLGICFGKYFKQSLGLLWVLCCLGACWCLWRAHMCINNESLEVQL